MGYGSAARSRARADGEELPIFLLCCARSGSTLLRLLLDAHPDIACPPETNVSLICERLAFVWNVLEGKEPGEPVSPEALSEMRRTVSAALGRYVRSKGKRRWCDKSLVTIDASDLLARVFPDASFVCLYRHALDVVRSGLDACPWSFGPYGFEPYVRASPDNLVRALLQYWIDRTSRLLEFQEAHTARCHRLYYEVLVSEPDQTLSDLLRFVGVEVDVGLSARALARPYDVGPGDHKILFTQAISTDRVGAGSTVPIRMIPAAQLETVNRLLERLGYPVVDGDWTEQGSPLRPPHGAPSEDRTKELRAAESLLETQLTRLLADHAGSQPQGEARIAFRLTLEDLGRSWLVDPAAGSVRRSDSLGTEGQAGWGIVTTSLALAEMARGTHNVGESLRRGTIRYVGGDDSHNLVTARLRGLVGLLSRAVSPAPPTARSGTS